MPAGIPQQGRHPTVAVATILPGQGDDVFSERGFVICPTRHLALCRSMLPEHTAGPPLGQALAFDGVKVSRGDAGAATWISGELVFDNVTLVDAITEVNRYSMQKIVLVGGAAAGRRQLSGVFKTGDVSTFARAVEAYGMARIERQNASEIRLSGI